MVSLPRPPSPEHYFATIIAHGKDRVLPRQPGSFVLRHVFSVSDLLEHEMKLLEVASLQRSHEAAGSSSPTDSLPAREARHAARVKQVLEGVLPASTLRRYRARAKKSLEARTRERIGLHVQLAKANKDLGDLKKEKKAASREGGSSSAGPRAGSASSS